MPRDYGILISGYRLDADHPFRLFHYRREPYWGAPTPDMHHAVHFGVMIEGEMEFHYPQQRVLQLKRGDVFFTAPWEAHCDRGVGKTIEAINFAILPEQLGRIGLDCGVEWLTPFLLPVNERISKLSKPLRKRLLQLAEDARQTVSEGEETYSVAAWLKLHEMLLVVLEGAVDSLHPSTTESGRADIHRILPAIALVHSHVKQPVSLEDAAKTCSMGRSRFSSLFQSSMGISFGRFAVRARLAAAYREIIHTHIPFKSIAAEFGFFDSSHLCRVFQEHYGFSPKAIRSNKSTLEPHM